jgi:hypothetical protein
LSSSRIATSTAFAVARLADPERVAKALLSLPGLADWAYFERPVAQADLEKPLIMVLPAHDGWVSIMGECVPALSPELSRALECEVIGVETHEDAPELIRADSGRTLRRYASTDAESVDDGGASRKRGRPARERAVSVAVVAQEASVLSFSK